MKQLREPGSEAAISANKFAERADRLYRERKYSESVKVYLLSATLHEQLSATKPEHADAAASLHHTVGDIHRRFRRHDQAFQALLNAVRAYRNVAPCRGLAIARLKLGLAEIARGLNEEANREYLEGVQVWEGLIGPPPPPPVMSWVERIFAGLIEYETEVRQIVSFHSAFAEAFENAGDLQKAIVASRNQIAALKLLNGRVDSSDHSRTVAHALELLGRKLVRAGLLGEAQAAYREASTEMATQVADAIERLLKYPPVFSAERDSGLLLSQILHLESERRMRRNTESISAFDSPPAEALSSFAPVGFEADVKKARPPQTPSVATDGTPNPPDRKWAPRAAGRPRKGEGGETLFAFLREVYGPYFVEHRKKLRSYIHSWDKTLWDAIKRYEINVGPLPHDIRMPTQRENAQERIFRAAKKLVHSQQVGQKGKGTARRNSADRAALRRKSLRLDKLDRE